MWSARPLSDPDAQARFSHLARDSQPDGDSDAEAEAIGDSQVRHPADGSLMVKVDGSVFLSGPSNEPVWLSTFYIDVHPVSNAEYARFVAATGHPEPQHWDDDLHSPERLANHPVVFVTWNDAAAYAEWAGKALPTSEQWEKTARGTRGNVHPWGDQPTPAVRENGVAATSPVDCSQSGVSPHGVYDLCGNVWEWCGHHREVRSPLADLGISARRPDRAPAPPDQAGMTQGRRLDQPLQPRHPSSLNDAAATICDERLRRKKLLGLPRATRGTPATWSRPPG